MDLNTNLENMHQQCRICLKNGDINIWNCRVWLKNESEANDASYKYDCSAKSFIEVMNIFFNSQDLLNLTEQFPLLCGQCLEDLKFCYNFYEKVKLASIQLENIYLESLNQCIEEEHLIEVTEEDLENLTDRNVVEPLEEKILNLPQYELNNAKELATSKHITVNENDSFIVTQFVHETVEATENCSGNETKSSDDGEVRPQSYFTLNLKAVEVKNFENLDIVESSKPLNNDITDPAIYICQYCPHSFAKSEYLKTHIQKSHVCKFCTQPFLVTEDLFSHIREVHTEHKCAICFKTLSSGTNLRHHIKRVHHIKLPAKVTLIDFIKSTSQEEESRENEMEISEELIETSANIEFDEKYMVKIDDCIEILTEANNSEMG